MWFIVSVSGTSRQLSLHYPWMGRRWSQLILFVGLREEWV